MKNFRFGICSILFVFVAFPLLADSGPSTNGSFKFGAASGELQFEFHAKAESDGSAKGEIKMSGSVTLPDHDDSGESVTEVSMRVDVDCLSVNGNSAVMSGKITDSSNPAYVGSRATLAVEDNGEGKKDPPDRFTWGLYAAPELTWLATDAELEFDSGVGLTWLATDFEREDDVGVPSNASTEVDCHSFPVGAYAFEALPQNGDGNIQVKP